MAKRITLPVSQFFIAMYKRITLHFLFWAVYLLADVLLVFFWDLPRLGSLPDNERLLLALQLCMFPLVLKMAFTYVTVYVILERVLTKKGTITVAATLGIALALLTVFLIRLAQTYFTYPLVFGTAFTPPSYLNAFAFLFGLLDLGFVSGAAAALHVFRVQLKAKALDEEREKFRLETELKYLKNQLNPHFLFNTLNNIYVLARKKSNDTPEVVMKLSKILRVLLNESGETSIALEDEVKLILDYIDLEKIRHRNGIRLSVTVDIDEPDTRISPFLLLPFVENAFKHGISHSASECTITILVQLRSGMFCFRIENTKEEGGEDGTTQIGLSNIKRQLELLYPAHTLEVNDLQGIFVVTLLINLNENGYNQLPGHRG